MSGKLMTTMEGVRAWGGMRDPKQIVANRITRRFKEDIEDDKVVAEVRGGLLDRFGTRHDNSVYSRVASQMLAAHVEIEVHTVFKLIPIAFGIETRKPLYLREPHDLIIATSLGGMAVETNRNFPHDRPNHVAQVYPPPPKPVNS